jgi:hypothetical protein
MGRVRHRPRCAACRRRRAGSHRLELLVALGMLLAAQMGQRRVRRHLDVVDAIVNRNRALQHRAAEGDVPLARHGVRCDVHFRHDFGRACEKQCASPSRRFRSPDPRAQSARASSPRSGGRESPASRSSARCGPRRSKWGRPRRAASSHRSRTPDTRPRTSGLRRGLIGRNPHHLAHLAPRSSGAALAAGVPFGPAAPGIARVDHAVPGAGDGGAVLDRRQLHARGELVVGSAGSLPLPCLHKTCRGPECRPRRSTVQRASAHACERARRPTPAFRAERSCSDTRARCPPAEARRGPDDDDLHRNRRH